MKAYKLVLTARKVGYLYDVVDRNTGDILGTVHRSIPRHWFGKRKRRRRDIRRFETKYEAADWVKKGQII